MTTPRRIHQENLELTGPAIVVHGGAGAFEVLAATPSQLPRLVAGLEAALAAGWEVLAAGGPALDAAVATVAVLEADGAFNAGRGAVTTTDGTVELDAAVMDGATGGVGAIAAATWPASPVGVARAVLGLGGPAAGPTLLVGAGADRFATEHGFAGRPTDEGTPLPVAPVSEAGTVGAVAVDSSGHVAAATSTGGRSGQRPGRVGDSPLPGAGTWADDATVAVSATGDGEAFVVAGFAHRIAWALEAGAELPAAAIRALDAVASRGGSGGAIVLGAPATAAGGSSGVVADGSNRSASGDSSGLPPGSSGRSAGGAGRVEATVLWATVLWDTPAMARGWRDASGATVRVLEEALLPAAPPTPAGS